MSDAGAIQGAMQARQLNRATELLLGLVTGIIADNQINDMEVQFLRFWLRDNAEVASRWPGCAIAKQIEAVIADGVITEEEREHLLKTLKDMATTDFSETGSTHAEVMAMPFDHEMEIVTSERRICLTGEFLYGTRAACERLAEKAGALPMNTVSRKVHFLIVGSNVSPNWAHTSYGRKIQAAMELRMGGHTIGIISERRWIESLGHAMPQ